MEYVATNFRSAERLLAQPVRESRRAGCVDWLACGHRCRVACTQLWLDREDFRARLERLHCQRYAGEEARTTSGNDNSVGIRDFRCYFASDGARSGYDLGIVESVDVLLQQVCDSRVPNQGSRTSTLAVL